jgi:hypothetical protein
MHGPVWVCQPDQIVHAHWHADLSVSEARTQGEEDHLFVRNKYRQQYYSACFFSRNSIFLSKKSVNSVFQPFVRNKYQQQYYSACFFSRNSIFL